MALIIEPQVTDALRDHVDGVRAALDAVPMSDVERLVEHVVQAHATNRHVYIIGNGGSASTATHFACDVGKATIVEVRARLKERFGARCWFVEVGFESGAIGHLDNRAHRVEG